MLRVIEVYFNGNCLSGRNGFTGNTENQISPMFLCCTPGGKHTFIVRASNLQVEKNHLDHKNDLFKNIS